MLRKGIGIDIGSTQISICALEGGLLLREPNVAAVDPETGKVTALIIPGRMKWLGLLGREPETVIPWDGIRRLGEDIIFVGKAQRLDPEGAV